MAPNLASYEKTHILQTVDLNHLQDAQDGRSARPQRVKGRGRTPWGTLRV